MRRSEEEWRWCGPRTVSDKLRADLSVVVASLACVEPQWSSQPSPSHVVALTAAAAGASARSRTQTK